MAVMANYYRYITESRSLVVGYLQESNNVQKEKKKTEDSHILK